MPKPATFTPAEISTLASRLREGWRPGSQITPWLRDNTDRLTKLNREERHHRRVQAEIPLIPVFEFGQPPLWIITGRDFTQPDEIYAYDYMHTTIRTAP